MTVAPPVDITIGSYLIVPYQWDRGDPSKNEIILSHCAEIANLFALPMSEDARKVAVAQRLTSPENLSWEVWRKSPVAPMALVGIISVTRVIRGLDALAHFVFFDRQLVGRRPLISTMLTWCFEQLELRRISVEIPDHLEPLIRFARKLGFRYEGESLAAQESLPQIDRSVHDKAQWAAKWGSRKERMHVDEMGNVHDCACLVLHREAFMK